MRCQHLHERPPKYAENQPELARKCLMFIHLSVLFTALLKLLLSKCCGNYSLNCWKVIYQPPETDPEQLLRSARDSHVIFPVIVDKQEATDEKLKMISLIPPASIAFVVPKGKRESYPKKLLMSVFEAWPVLILTILLSILAGVFLWLLVSDIAWFFCSLNFLLFVVLWITNL